jgi:UDP-glucuronate 4-epimerase
MFGQGTKPTSYLMLPIIVTGAAGFIGFHVCKELLNRGHHVVALDNLNAYYDVQLKHDRLKLLMGNAGFTFHEVDIFNRERLVSLFKESKADRVIHLAAQAGVRYSISDPHSYADSNLTGFLNILEVCRQNGIGHLVFASSSSVYGANAKTPFSVSDAVDKPVSLYAATKRANELMAYTYSHLYGIPVTGLRFFTVYGPWGRPDMAYFKFTKAILEGSPINVYNQGNMLRDFTYIDDIVDGVLRVLKTVPKGEDADATPYKLYNIGNNSPIRLGDFISTLEKAIGKKAIINYLPMQSGDVPATFADIADLTNDTGFCPKTSIEIGLPKFVEWYNSYTSSVKE